MLFEAAFGNVTYHNKKINAKNGNYYIIHYAIIASLVYNDDMKKRAYAIIVFITLLTFTLDGLNEYFDFQKRVSDAASKTYEERKLSYNGLVKNEKAYLGSMAAFLVKNKTVIQAYKEDNRSKIIELVSPLWKELKKKNLVYEMHFFKRPVISYVNFSNLRVFNVDVSLARGDIAWIESSFTPSEHFYVCRTFPGFRATYPIVSNDILLGAVSIGGNIEQVAKLLESLGSFKAFVALKKKLLQETLVESAYKHIEKRAYEKNGYLYVTDTAYEIKLHSGFEIKDEKLYSMFTVSDFAHKLVGYMVTIDDFSSVYKEEQKHAVLHFSIFMAIFGILFGFAVLFINSFIKRVEGLQKVLDFISNKQFSKLEEITNPKNEFDYLENAVIKTGKEVGVYISILSNKVKDYASKANTDQLTGVFNRRGVEEVGEYVFRKAVVSEEPLSIILFDVDNFKQVNDVYGHDMGDLVLVEIAQHISKALREDDVFIRYGGEEFLIIFPGLNIADCYKVGLKLLDVVRSIELKVHGDEILKVTVSMGASTMQDDKDLSDIITRADKKLYEAKRAGKNRIEV